MTDEEYIQSVAAMNLYWPSIRLLPGVNGIGLADNVVRIHCRTNEDAEQLKASGGMNPFRDKFPVPFEIVASGDAHLA